jgi:hypothetical protein
MNRVLTLMATVFVCLAIISGCSSSDNSGTGPTQNPSATIAAEVVAVWFDVPNGYGLDIKSDGSATELARSGSGLIIVAPSGATFKFSSFKNGAWAGTRKIGSTTTDVSGTYAIASGKMTMTETQPTSTTLIAAGGKSSVGANPQVSTDVVGVWYSASQMGGIKINSDGTAQMLMVNGSGNLVVNPNGPTITYSLAENGGWHAVVTPQGESPENQTGTYTLTGGVLAIYESTPDSDIVADDLVPRTLGQKVI